MLHRWGRARTGARCDLELLIRASHVRVSSDGGVGGAGGSLGADGAPLLTRALVADFEHFWAYFGRATRAPLAGRRAPRTQ